MAAVIRLFFLGWAFAIVLFIAWLGALFPDRSLLPSGPPTHNGSPVSDRSALPHGGPRSDRFTRGAPAGADNPASTFDQECRHQEPVPAEFFSQSAVLRPESQDELAAFSLRLRSMPCLADVTGNYCTPDQVAVTLAGHAEPVPSADATATQRLSFERALAVAVVLMANNVTVRSVEGFGDSETGEVAGIDPSGTMADHHLGVDLGLRCPRRSRP